MIVFIIYNYQTPIEVGHIFANFIYFIDRLLPFKYFEMKIYDLT